MALTFNQEVVARLISIEAKVDTLTTTQTAQTASLAAVTTKLNTIDGKVSALSLTGVTAQLTAIDLITRQIRDYPAPTS
jgi:hypothetical protein